MLLYTDGITERVRSDGEMYETGRLTAALARADGLEPASALDRIVADLDSFADGHEPEDDQTLVLLAFA